MHIAKVILSVCVCVSVRIVRTHTEYNSPLETQLAAIGSKMLPESWVKGSFTVQFLAIHADT